MQITEVTTTLLTYPHAKAVQDSTVPAASLSAGGRSQLFVHIHTDEGIEGLGIGQASPGVRDVVETTLRRVLIGQDPFNIEKLWNDMFWHVRGFGRKGVAFCALSAVDIGLWDLKAKALGLPLYRLLGPYAESVPVYGSGGWTNMSQDELLTEMSGYVEQGIGRVKMKVGKDFGRSEREDLQRVAAVRRPSVTTWRSTSTPTTATMRSRPSTWPRSSSSSRWAGSRSRCWPTTSRAWPR